MESLLTTLVPLVSAGGVYVLVAGIKRLRAIKFADNKKPILRVSAGILSFAGVVALSLATGQEVDPTQLTNLVDLLLATGLAYTGATGIHTLNKE